MCKVSQAEFGILFDELRTQITIRATESLPYPFHSLNCFFVPIPTIVTMFSINYSLSKNVKDSTTIRVYAHFAPQPSPGKTPFWAHVVVSVLACMIREEGKHIALPTADMSSVHHRLERAAESEPTDRKTLL